MRSRYTPTRRALIVWTLFIGLGAVAGALGMLLDPSGRTLGMDAMLPYFQVLPFAELLFQNFVFSGWALLIVNGLSNLTAAALLIGKKQSGVVLGGVFGMMLMLWIGIQFYIFPLNFMSTAYFIFGFLQAATGYAACIFAAQERFHFDASDYPNVGKDSHRLVVYFSRMGYVRKKAYETAECTGAAIYEIHATEKTSGTPGFWWCGRYGLMRRAMPIEPVDIDLTAYDHVTICSSIWVFSVNAPVRAFCEQATGKIHEADYILLHFTRGRYKSVADTMDRLLKLRRTQYTDIRCRAGHYAPPTISP